MIAPTRVRKNKMAISVYLGGLEKAFIFDNFGFVSNVIKFT